MTNTQDRQLFCEFLYAERALATLYQQGALYATNPGIRNEMLNLLSELQQICIGVSGEISKRQWLKPFDPVEQKKIEDLKAEYVRVLSTF